MSATLTLVSHALCPYVQRAAIVLAEKGVAFERLGGLVQRARLLAFLRQRGSALSASIPATCST